MALAVVIAEAVPENVHGVLSRWLVKVGPCTYVGHVSSRVRTELWAALVPIIRDGRVMLIHPDGSEQGYAVVTAGQGRYRVLDFDGLQLVGLGDHSPFGDNETITP